MSVPTKIYYDSKDGFLWGEDAQGNLEKVKTDACVLMPENVRVDLDGHIIVQDLHGEDQLLRDPNDQIVSIKGPAGKNGRDGKDGRDVVCDYKTTDTVKFHKIVSQLNPGTYTIYGNVIGGIGDPFSSACLIIGLTNLALGYLPLIVNFGQKFQLATKQDISIVFVCYDYAKDMYDGNHTDWMVEALTDFTMSVENVYVCTHGDTPYINGSNWFVGGVDTGVAAQGPKGDKGDQGNTGDSVYVLTNSDVVTLTNYFSNWQALNLPTAFDVMIDWANNSCPPNNEIEQALTAFVSDVLQSHHKYFIYNGYMFTHSIGQSGFVEHLSYQSLKGYKGDKGDATTISSTNYANGVTTITFSDSTTVQINDGNQGIPGSLFVATNDPDQAFETGQMQLQMRAGDYSISNDTNTLWVCLADGSFVKAGVLKGDLGPQGAKGDQGDSYFTQPVADKLTAIAGEYDNVKQEVDDLRFDYDLLQGDYDSMKDMALPYIDKFKDLYDTYGDELTPLLQKCKDLFDKHKDEDLSDLLDRCKAKLELLDQIDLSGLAVAYPKDTTPEEA